MKNIELARTKLERAQLLFENFEEISEEDLKNIFGYVMSALELTPFEHADKYELYGQVRNLAAMEIKKYGAIFKAISWKDSVIIDKKDVKEILDRTDFILG